MKKPSKFKNAKGNILFCQIYAMCIFIRNILQDIILNDFTNEIIVFQKFKVINRYHIFGSRKSVFEIWK